MSGEVVEPFEVLIGDGRGIGSGENVPVHGPADVAAGMASRMWRGSAVAAALDVLGDAVRDATDLMPGGVFGTTLDDACNALEFATEDAARMGARMGFALGRVIEKAELGWPAWEAAALAWLATAGCDLAEHDDPVEKNHLNEAQQVREKIATHIAQQERVDEPKPTLEPLAHVAAAVDRATSALQTSLSEHVARHHGSPNDLTVAFMQKGIDRILSTVLGCTNELDETLRLRHEELLRVVLPAPVPAPRRQPAASRAATAPPTRHRAADVGHVAAAVPSFDQCAAEDLELAGHRHPRADDAWVASLG